MWRVGNHYGNEFRYRKDGPMVSQSAKVSGSSRLEGDYLKIDLVKMAEGMGAKTYRPITAMKLEKSWQTLEMKKGQLLS
jgi:3D-(3,5/4)-trihydroxycyclohexane-1,2-dione acylhydrolase (decyclizing)